MYRLTKFIFLVISTQCVLGKWLVFPTTGPVFKFLAGFGVPVEELNFETIVVGNVFKTKFRLPASARQIFTHTTTNVNGKRSVDGHLRGNFTVLDSNFLESAQNSEYTGESDKDSNFVLADWVEENHPKGSGYRWAIYKGLEAIGDRMGLIGRACVLKSICEMAETPFHYHNGIYAELLHILFTPSSSVDKLSMYSDNEYLYAEAMGKSGAPCARVFKDCRKSLLDRFSDIYEMTQDIFRRIEK